MIRELYGFDTYPIRGRHSLVLRNGTGVAAVLFHCLASFEVRKLPAMCKDRANRAQNVKLACSLCRVQPILCKDSARRRRMQIYLQPFTILSYSIHNLSRSTEKGGSLSALLKQYCPKQDDRRLDFVIAYPKILRQRVQLFSDALPSAWFAYKPPCLEEA